MSHDKIVKALNVFHSHNAIIQTFKLEHWIFCIDNSFDYGIHLLKLKRKSQAVLQPNEDTKTKEKPHRTSTIIELCHEKTCSKSCICAVIAFVFATTLLPKSDSSICDDHGRKPSHDMANIMVFRRDIPVSVSLAGLLHTWSVVPKRDWSTI